MGIVVGVTHKLVCGHIIHAIYDCVVKEEIDWDQLRISVRKTAVTAEIVPRHFMDAGSEAPVFITTWSLLSPGGLTFHPKFFVKDPGA